jgi:uncharacterized protein (TIGR02001 family)
MRKSLLSLAVLSALSLPTLSFADTAAPVAEPASPHTFSYNVGLYSQYVFRGLTQTGENLALQGGVDYSHVSGFYAGAWASNISWLEDAGTAGMSAYKNSSIELDLYGGYRNSIGDTGIGYDIGLLQYIYPGDNNNNWINDAETTEIYGALSWKWLQAKYSHIVSSDAWGTPNGRNTYYAELNANIPLADTGITANLHVGRQDFSGEVAGLSNDQYSYTDWKIGATKSFSNGINIGGYYTDTNANKVSWTDQSGQYLGDSQFTVFVQKTF